jgi:metallo-beta-lactamase class B
LRQRAAQTDVVRRIALAVLAVLVGFFLAMGILRSFRMSVVLGAWGIDRPADPVRIADNLYYVGASDAAAFLIVGDKGHVLIDGGTENMPALIVRNVRRLGFEPRDIRVVLSTHGHFDHAGGIAELKRITGARLYASPREATLIRAGGRGDFLFGDWFPYPEAAVDHVLADRETVRLGRTRLTALVTPGHTRGCTSWSIPVTVRARPRHALLQCSVNLLFGGIRQYPGMKRDFRATFARLRSMPCDILLGPHASHFRLSEKRAGRVPWVDPRECREFLESKEAEVLSRL